MIFNVEHKLLTNFLVFKLFLFCICFLILSQQRIKFVNFSSFYDKANLPIFAWTQIDLKFFFNTTIDLMNNKTNKKVNWKI